MAASLTPETTGTLLNAEPASASQRRTWFMELIAPGVPQHHLPIAVEVFGEIDVAALQLSLDAVVERHESLRTLFLDDGGTLHQVISDLRPEVQLVDAPSSPTTDLKAILHEQVAAPFSLSQGPLVRVIIVRRARDVNILVFVLHHIIADNLSLGLFVREMAETYTSFCTRDFPALTPLPWQYADFAVAEARWLATHTFRDRLQRYAETLGPTIAPLNFCADQSVRSGQLGTNALLPVDAATLDRLKEVAQQSGVTLFTVLLAALQTVLAPYAEGSDFVIAVPVAGRSSDGAERIIGPFANSIAVRASVRADQTIAQLVTDVGHRLVDTLEYENVPWDALVRATNPSRNADAAPLSQVMFSSVAVPTPFRRFGPLPCRPTWIPSPAPTADLFVTASETPNGFLWIGLDSRPDKVPTRTVARLSNALRTVLLQIAHEDIATLEAFSKAITDEADASRTPVRGAIDNSRSHRSIRNVSAASEHDAALEKLVMELWQQLLGSAPNHIREDFFAAGGDSLMAVQLMSALSRRLDRKLAVALFFQDPTVSGLVSGIEESSSDNGSDHAVTRIVKGDDGRLLFICSAQRNSINLAKALGPGPTVYKLDVYNLQEQRLLADQPMFDSVEAIATEFISRMKVIQPEGPYLLAGGCEGGIVALEMALQLQQAGEEIALLGQLDTPVRGFFESKPALLTPIRVAKRRFDVRLRRMLTPDAEGYEWHLRIWGGIWTPVRAYYPGRPFDGDVHIFKAARTFGMVDVTSGWDRQVSGRVLTHRVPGGHDTWMEYPQSAAIVRAALDEIVPVASTTSKDQIRV